MALFRPRIPSQPAVSVRVRTDAPDRRPALRFLFGFSLLALFLRCGSPAPAYFDGPPPGYTGAPGESTCASCHNSFPLNAGPGSFVIAGAPLRYTPGQTYLLMVTIAQQGQKRWGFQISSRITGTRNRGGTLDLGNPAFEQFGRNPPAPALQYVEHNEPGTHPGTGSGVPVPDGPVQFPVRWIAPPAGTGSVTLYGASNAANFNNNSDGDYIYTTQVQLDEGSGIALSLLPDHANIRTGDTADFNAVVTGVTAPRVAWNLRMPNPLDPKPADMGTLVCDDTHDKLICGGSHVRYIAPAALGAPLTVQLLATSLDDLDKTASATISVTPNIGVTLGPTTAATVPGGQVQFTPTIVGTTVTGLNWTVQDAAGGPEEPGGSPQTGTVSPSGLYTAPAVVSGPLNVVVRARSQANSGIFGSATVSVSDTIPPTVTLTQPAPGTFVRGKVPLSADASDNAAVANVSWLIDGAASPIAVAPMAPYTATWDTSSSSDGPHTLVARAVDAAGNVTPTPPITVTVDNTPPVYRKIGIEPFVFLHQPVRLTPDVSDNLGLAQVSFHIDQQKPFAVATTPPFSVMLDPTSLPDGRYTLNSDAVDLAGNTTPAPKAIFVVDNTPPTASIVQPADGAIVKGLVPITGTVGDANFAKYALEYGSGAAPAQWQPIGGEVLHPVQNDALGQWNALALPAGIYTLRLTATDQAGLTTTETHAVTLVRAGDVDGNGQIDISDALLALQIAVGVIPGTPEQIAAADIAPIGTDGAEGDGSVTAGDAVLILRLALGLPVGPVAPNTP